MAHLPKYTGVTVTLPGGIKTHPYFKATNVADWSLQGFMTATGKDENSFLSAIGNLAKFKPVPRDVRSFARSLHDLYGGIFRDQVVDIAKDDAKSRINRQSFIRKEKLITQRSYKDDLEQNLRAKDQGLQSANINSELSEEPTDTVNPEFKEHGNNELRLDEESSAISDEEIISISYTKNRSDQEEDKGDKPCKPAPCETRPPCCTHAASKPV